MPSIGPLDERRLVPPGLERAVQLIECRLLAPPRGAPDSTRPQRVARTCWARRRLSVPARARAHLNWRLPQTGRVQLRVASLALARRPVARRGRMQRQRPAGPSCSWRRLLRWWPHSSRAQRTRQTAPLALYNAAASASSTVVVVAGRPLAAPRGAAITPVVVHRLRAILRFAHVARLPPDQQSLAPGAGRKGQAGPLRQRACALGATRFFFFCLDTGVGCLQRRCCAGLQARARES